MSKIGCGELHQVRVGFLHAVAGNDEPM